MQNLSASGAAPTRPFHLPRPSKEDQARLAKRESSELIHNLFLFSFVSSSVPRIELLLNIS